MPRSRSPLPQSISIPRLLFAAHVLLCTVPAANRTSRREMKGLAYEHDSFKSEDVFGEWELCPGNFTDGKYVYFKVNEFNATFICPNCSASDGVDGAASVKRVVPVIVIVLCVSASAKVAAGFLAQHEYSKKRNREHEKAIFLKIFEGDDIDDELGLGDVQRLCPLHLSNTSSVQ